MGEVPAPSKHLFQSKTFWGAVIALVAVVFPGLWMAVGLGDDYGMLADKVTGIVAALIVIKGRLDAGGIHILPKG